MRRVQICNLDLCVHLDARLGLTKVRPRKQSKRQVDRRGSQRVDRIVQIDTEILARIKRPGSAHQTYGKILPNPPVPVFVGIRESRFGSKRSTEHLLQFCQRSGGSGSYAMRLSMA